jgi:hypothetical protein
MIGTSADYASLIRPTNPLTSENEAKTAFRDARHHYILRPSIPEFPHA